MFTSLFRKSTPLNYSLLIIGVVFSFFLYQISNQSASFTWILLLQKTTILGLILASLFTINFITKRNGLSKDSSYSILFYFLLLQFFPSVWNNLSLLISNFFILLALRRIISIQSLKAPKEKIFDASIWIFIASLFHFWSILFIILVFIAIFFHVARDYRNWFLPFIAFFTVATIVVFFSLMFRTDWINYLLKNASVNYKFDYFENNYQNLAFSIYVTIALFFLFSLLLTLSKRPLILHSSFKKIIIAFLIGIAVLIVSPYKSNDLLLFTFAPLSIMATSHIEMPQSKLNQEIVLAVFMICGLFCFFSQL